MTIVEWVPLFMNPEIVALIYKSLNFVRNERNVLIYGYVIMEHHLHIIVSSPELSKTIKEFKSFTARAIIGYLEERKASGLLEKLRHAKLRHKTTSEYQVWQEGSHPEEISSTKMLIQKVEYMHANPVRRGYVDEPRHWRYSSARTYEGEIGLLDVKTD